MLGQIFDFAEIYYKANSYKLILPGSIGGFYFSVTWGICTEILIKAA